MELGRSRTVWLSLDGLVVSQRAPVVAFARANHTGNKGF